MDPTELKYVELIKKLDNSDLKAIIKPVLPEVCERTEDQVNFALRLVALSVMTDNQFEQFKLEGTPFQRNIYLYNNVMKKAAGKELIKALQKSGNEHIIKILVGSYRKVIAKEDEDEGCGQGVPLDAISPALPTSSTSVLRESVDGGNSSVRVTPGQESIGDNTVPSVVDPATASKSIPEVQDPEAQNQIDETKVTGRELLITSSTSALRESVDSVEGGNSSVTVNAVQEKVDENTMTSESEPATGFESIPKVKASEKNTIYLKYESIKVIYDRCSPCSRSLKHLEFVHFTSPSKFLKPLQFSCKRQPLNFLELVSLAMKIDQEDYDSAHKKSDDKNGLPSKETLKSLLSVFNWHGIKRNELYEWFGVKKNKKRNRLNNLWDLFPQINVVDIRIGNKTILYFNKQDGQLTVHWMPFFDPNKYLKKVGDTLKKFSCAKNYKPLSMSSISPNNLTELNLRNCKFDFNPKNNLNLNDFFPKYKNLSKLIMSASKYKDSNSNTIFNLDYIATASELKIITLGNFTVTVTDSSASAFTNIWNRFNGETLTFCDCTLNLKDLKLQVAIKKLKKRADNKKNEIEKDKIIVQLQKSKEFDGQTRENSASIGDKNSVSWHVSGSTSSDRGKTDNGWSLISNSNKPSLDLLQTYDQIFYNLFEIKDFSTKLC